MFTLRELLTKESVNSHEVVEFLNYFRDDSEPTLRHDHFMRKVAKVLGKDMVKIAGMSRRGYTFSRREACLMVMSYGYDHQASMFDLLTSTTQ